MYATELHLSFSRIKLFVFSNSDLLKSNKKSKFEENKQAAHTPPFKTEKKQVCWF